MSVEDFIGAGSDGTCMFTRSSVLNDLTSTTYEEPSEDGLSMDDALWDDVGVEVRGFGSWIGKSRESLKQIHKIQLFESSFEWFQIN